MCLRFRNESTIGFKVEGHEGVDKERKHNVTKRPKFIISNFDIFYIFIQTVAISPVMRFQFGSRVLKVSTQPTPPVKDMTHWTPLRPSNFVRIPCHSLSSPSSIWVCFSRWISVDTILVHSEQCICCALRCFASYKETFERMYGFDYERIQKSIGPMDARLVELLDIVGHVRITFHWGSRLGAATIESKASNVVNKWLQNPFDVDEGELAKTYNNISIHYLFPGSLDINENGLRAWGLCMAFSEGKIWVYLFLSLD